MRKIFISLNLFLFFNGHSQVKTQLKMSAHKFKFSNFILEPVVGAGISKILNYDNKHYKAYYMAGVKANYFVSASWNFQTGLTYSREGARLIFKNDTVKYVDKANLNYLRLPLEAAFNFKKNAYKFAPYISAGISFGYLAGGKKTFSKNDVITSTDNSHEFFDRMDIGIGGAVGCRVNRLNISISTFRSLSNVLNYASSYPPLKNIYSSVIVGYIINKRK